MSMQLQACLLAASGGAVALVGVNGCGCAAQLRRAIAATRQRPCHAVSSASDVSRGRWRTKTHFHWRASIWPGEMMLAQ